MQKPQVSLNLTTSRCVVDTEIVLLFKNHKFKNGPKKDPFYFKEISRISKTNPDIFDFNSAEFINYGGKNNALSVVFAGLGNPKTCNEKIIRLAASQIFNLLNEKKIKSARIDIGYFEPLIKNNINKFTLERVVEIFNSALVSNAYCFDKHKTNKEKFYLSKIYLYSSKTQKNIISVLNNIEQSQIAINVTRNWSNEPPNVGTPAFYAGEAKTIAKSYKIHCQVLDNKQIKKEKMGLFLAVERGSAEESRIVIFDYKPKKITKNTKTIVLIGKGITFDSGGLCLKPRPGMSDMKHDMTGAATVMGATILASKLGSSNRIVSIMGFAENMPGGAATKPGSIITSRSGKTVEILNTDAEGRLVLADLIDYAHKYKPNVIIDIATLTGAVVVALGSFCSGIMGNSDKLIKDIISAGDMHGEALWQLPLFDEYLETMKPNFADLNETSKEAGAGTIRGGLFLKQFIKNKIPWAHIDIAGTAWNANLITGCPKIGASGIHVRTLAQFIRDYK